MSSTKWMAGLASLFITAAGAGPPPTDIELRAAYCLEVVRSRIRAAEPFISLGEGFKKLLDAEKHNEKRLRSYLLIKINSFDAAILSGTKVAMSMALDDLKETENAGCLTNLKKRYDNQPLTHYPEEEINQCIEAVKKTPASQRVQRCKDLSWLPF